VDSKLAFIIVLVAVLLVVGSGVWLLFNRVGLKIGCGGPNIVPCSFEKFTCPSTGWVDCLPGIGSDKPQCRKDYLDWAKTNCPDFRGVAY
jgi:hypothetical protein